MYHLSLSVLSSDKSFLSRGFQPYTSSWLARSCFVTWELLFLVTVTFPSADQFVAASVPANAHRCYACVKLVMGYVL